MKVAVLNFSGNVGKSTVARHLLRPRMTDPAMLAIESINTDELADPEQEVLRGKALLQLRRALAIADEAIVDVGASNIEPLMLGMREQVGAHEDFDRFIVPTTPQTKQQKDTINTVAALRELGTPPERIHVVFNMVERGTPPNEACPAIFRYHALERSFTLSPRAVIHDSAIFALLREHHLDLETLASDTTDLRAKMRVAKSNNEKAQLADHLAARGMAVNMAREMDAVYRELFG